MSTSVLRTMGRALVCSGLALTLAVATAVAQQEMHDEWHPQPRDTIDADTYQGWKQFELNCSRCHGEYAVGSSFAPALVVSLKEGGTIPDEPTFITTVCAGRPDKGMPAWCALGLEMDKIQSIYKYVKARA
ncbi:MAG: c-type cytochrome, partial [bacterium]